MSDETSPSLLDRVRADDGAAWRRLVALYHPLVLAWCRQGGAGADAEDVAQEVFLAIARGLDGFQRAGAGGFRAWARGVTRHKLLDHFRRRGRSPVAAGGTTAALAVQGLPDPGPGSLDDATETGGLYGRALDLIRSSFEEKTWQAFWQAGVEGRDTAAVAAALGMSPTAVRIAKSRVLARLRQEAGALID
jgi:RNA polymerase sigma-70 factor (ECF subfamily)